MYSLPLFVCCQKKKEPVFSVFVVFCAFFHILMTAPPPPILILMYIYSMMRFFFLLCSPFRVTLAKQKKSSGCASAFFSLLVYCFFDNNVHLVPTLMIIVLLSTVCLYPPGVISWFHLWMERYNIAAAHTRGDVTRSVCSCYFSPTTTTNNDNNFIFSPMDVTVNIAAAHTQEFTVKNLLIVFSSHHHPQQNNISSSSSSTTTPLPLPCFVLNHSAGSVSTRRCTSWCPMTWPRYTRPEWKPASRRRPSTAPSWLRTRWGYSYCTSCDLVLVAFSVTVTFSVSIYLELFYLSIYLDTHLSTYPSIYLSVFVVTGTVANHLQYFYSLPLQQLGRNEGMM